MASPQLENGFTRITDKILETAAAAKLTATEYAIILIVWRYSYEFNRKSCTLSISFIEKATGMSNKGIRNEIKSLIERNILTVSYEPTFNTPQEFMFQKDYSKWNILPQEKGNAAEEPQYHATEVPQCHSTEVPQCHSTEVLQYPQQRNIKESIKKDMSKTVLNDPFKMFWEAYARRQAKQDALKAFRKLSPNDELLTVITEAVRR